MLLALLLQLFKLIFLLYYIRLYSVGLVRKDRLTVTPTRNENLLSISSDVNNNKMILQPHSHETTDSENEKLKN